MFAPLLAFALSLAPNADNVWHLDDIKEGEYRLIVTQDVERHWSEEPCGLPLLLNGERVRADKANSPSNGVRQVQSAPLRIKPGDVLRLTKGKQKVHGVTLSDEPLKDAWLSAWSVADERASVLCSFQGTELQPGKLIVKLEDLSGRGAVLTSHVIIRDYWRNVLADETHHENSFTVPFTAGTSESYRAEVIVTLANSATRRRVFTCRTSCAADMHKRLLLDDCEWETAEVVDDGTYATRCFCAQPPAEAKWRGVKLPYTVKDTWYHHQPTIHQHWFRTRFKVPSEFRNGRYEIEIERGGMFTQIYVNGKFCGQNEVWRQGLFHRADITSALNVEGDNELFVACQERSFAFEDVALRELKTLNEAGPIRMNYGTDAWGVFGLVALVTTPARAIEREVRIITSVRNKTIEAICEVPQGCRITHRVLERGREVVPPFERKTTWANPILWGPNEFPLLELESTLKDASGKVLDVRRTRFGFREFWSEGMKFMWNGKSVRGPGHAMTPRWGERTTDQDLMDDIVVGLADGNRFRRHASGTRMQYEMADEEGMLFSKTSGLRPVGCFPANYRNNPAYWENMRRCCLAMVDDYPNHPSIFTWYLSNEFYLESIPEAQKCIEPVIRDLQAKDPTRFVETGCDMDCGGRTGIISTHYPISSGFTTEETFIPDLYYWRPLSKPFTVGMMTPCGLQSNVANQSILSPIKWGTKPISVHETNWDYFIGFPHAPSRLWGEAAYNGVRFADYIHLFYSVDYLRGEREAEPYSIINWRHQNGDANSVAQPPEDAFIIQKFHTFYTGEKVHYEAVFTHDVLKDEALRLYWRLMYNGTEVKAWHADWRADYCQTRHEQIEFTLGAPGEYQLKYGIAGRAERTHCLTSVARAPALTSSRIIRASDALDESVVARARNGETLVVLPREDYPEVLPLALRLTNRRAAQNFTFRPTHPILANITEREFSYWYPTSFTGTRYFDKPTSGAARTLIEAGGPNGLCYSALIEFPVGRGALIFSRLDLTNTANPIAAKLLANALNYKATGEGAPLGVMFAPTSKEVATLRKMGVELCILEKPTAEQLNECAALLVDGAKVNPQEVASFARRVIVQNPSEAWRVTTKPFACKWYRARAVKLPAASASPLLAGLTNFDFFWRPRANGEKNEHFCNDKAANCDMGSLEIFGAEDLLYPRFLARKGRILYSTLNWCDLPAAEARKAERIVTTILANCGVRISPPRPLVVPSNLVFKPLDLRSHLTRTLADAVDDDGVGGWSDQGPEQDMHEWKPQPGVQRLGNGEFELCLPKALCALASKYRKVTSETPEQITLKVGRKADWLFWLHAAAWCSKQVQGFLDVHYADGSTYSITLSGEANLRDYNAFSPTDLFPNETETVTCLAASAPHKRWGKGSVFSTAWRNPQPQKLIKQITFRSEKRGVIMLLAASTATAGAARQISAADKARCNELMRAADKLKQQGKTREALAKLIDANKANSEQLNVYCDIGDMFMELGEAASAQKWYEESLRVNYNQPPLWERVKQAKAAQEKKK